MIAYIGIGANLGDARANVDDAVARLALLPESRLLRTSPYYRSAPIDASGDDYVNAVAAIDTRLPVPYLPSLCHPGIRSSLSFKSFVCDGGSVMRPVKLRWLPR